MKNIEKHILITGASSGIGKEAAKQIAHKNYNLILCARRYNELELVKKECEALGATSVYIFQLDISKDKSIDQLILKLKDMKIGIDVLINNAGFGNSSKFIDTELKIIEEMFAVNVVGLMYLTQNVVNELMPSHCKRAKIINIASMAGKISSPDFSIYTATKAAVISFSNALRIELKKKNIQVTVVNLGPVDTPFFDKLVGPRKYIGKNSLFTLTDKKAGKIILKSINKNKREINRPLILNLSEKIYRLSPAIGDYFLKKYYKN